MIVEVIIIMLVVALLIALAHMVVMWIALRAMGQLVGRAQAIFHNCAVETGYCCCGEAMPTHDNGMHSGHAPVDQGAYTADRWLADLAFHLGEEPPETAVKLH